MVNLTTLSTLISANHVLHFTSVFDAYGHVSVRNPDNPSTFYLAANIAPALVESEADFVEYYTANASSVDPNAPTGYIERFIHSEILKTYPAVNSVIHSHSADIIPFTVTECSLQPIFAIAGFFGKQFAVYMRQISSRKSGSDVPNFDVAKYYNQTQLHDLLIRDTRLGGLLAEEFTIKHGSKGTATLNHTVVLQRGHGFTVVGPTIELASWRAINAQTDARALQNSINLANADLGSPDVHYLSARERVDGQTSLEGTASRAWNLWVKQVEKYPGGLYVNQLSGSS